WHYGHSGNRYNDSRFTYGSLEWLTCVFDTQTKDIASGKPRVLVNDGLGTHKAVENDIVLTI
ncbi:hypothetical protein BU23DRAFT_487798, partial [Bimuria novae-zelandiae CBS 107.79]